MRMGRDAGGGSLAGVALAVLATLLWSSAFVCGRYLLGGERPLMDPYTLVLVRFVVGSAVVFGLAALRGQPLGIGRRQWPLLAGTSLFMYTLMSVFNFCGQRTVSATMAALILESGPALLLLVWNMVCGRRLSWAEWVSVLGGALGCMLVLNIITLSGVQVGGSALGQLLLLASALCWVVGSVWNQRLMMRADSKLALVGWCQLAGAVMMLPVLAVCREGLVLPRTGLVWAVAVCVGVFPTALAFVAWGEAAARLPLWQLSLMQNLTPVFTLLAASLLLGEPATMLNVVGMALVVASLSLAVLAGRRPSDA